MSLLNNSIKSNIKEHSLEDYPNECCGILAQNKDETVVVRCENIADNKKEFFEISPHDYLKASKIGRVKAYYHSHTGKNFSLSGADKAISISQRLPLIMYSIIRDNFVEYTV